MADTLIRLYEDTQKPGTCRGCAAPIDWYRTLNDKAMPMNRGAVPRKSENEPATKRVAAYFASSDSHWATCPDAAKFGRKSNGLR